MLEPFHYLFPVKLQSAVVFWSLRVISDPAVTAQLRGLAVTAPSLNLRTFPITFWSLLKQRSIRRHSTSPTLSHKRNARSSNDILVMRQSLDNCSWLLRNLVSCFTCHSVFDSYHFASENFSSTFLALRYEGCLLVLVTVNNYMTLNCYGIINFRCYWIRNCLLSTWWVYFEVFATRVVLCKLNRLLRH